MSKFALVEPTGRIAQIEEETFAIAEPYKWLECGDEVDATWRYEDGTFVMPEKDDQDAP